MAEDHAEGEARSIPLISAKENSHPKGWLFSLAETGLRENRRVTAGSAAGNPAYFLQNKKGLFYSL